jgi:hypothetical protein
MDDDPEPGIDDEIEIGPEPGTDDYLADGCWDDWPEDD